MITYKSKDDIVALRAAGKILANALDTVIRHVKPGVTTNELNAIAEKYLADHGTTPSFKGYGHPPFPSALCTSVGQEVVHTPASNRMLRDGEIIGVDIGLIYPANGKEYFVDMAKTVPVGKIDMPTKKLLKVTRTALDKGISQMKPGNMIADISRAIESYVRPHGYSIVRKLVGHGVGFAVHEEPKVPNFIEGQGIQIELKPGMVLAIEPMLNVGGADIKTLNDDWTIVTKDGSLSAHFEHTIAITEKGHQILTEK